MFAKYTLKYNYKGSEDMAPVDVTFEIPGDVSLSQILYQFENFLKASGFVFDGNLQIVEGEEDPKCCIADWDDEDIEASEEEDNLRKWNEDLRELEKRIKDQRAEELSEMNEHWTKLSNKEKADCLDSALKMSNPFDKASKKSWL